MRRDNGFNPGGSVGPDKQTDVVTSLHLGHNGGEPVALAGL